MNDCSDAEEKTNLTVENFFLVRQMPNITVWSEFGFFSLGKRSQTFECFKEILIKTESFIRDEKAWNTKNSSEYHLVLLLIWYEWW